MRNFMSSILFVLVFSAAVFGKGVFTITPSSLNFGAVNIGNTLTLPATITNTGNSILVISSITSSDSQFSFTANFPIRILEGLSTTVNLSFTPTTEGLQSGNLVFTHNGTGSITSFSVSGIGSGPVFSLDPVSLNFGIVNVGSSVILPVTISNSGEGSLIISDITSSDAQYTFTSPPLPVTLSAGQSSLLDITFTPTGEGTYPASLSFTHNASGSPAVLPVTGTGHILASTFNIDPVSLSFGTVNVGSSVSLPVTIINPGDASLIISDITSSDAQYTFSSSLPITVLPGGNTAIDITFTPTGEGTYPGNLSFVHNATGSPAVLSVTGTGHILFSTFNLDPVSLNFDTVNVGNFASLPVTISNSGDASLIISDITSSDAQYTFSSSLPITVLPGGNTAVDITFTPTGEGTYPGNLSFVHNAPGSPAVLPVTGTGHILVSTFNLDPVSLNFDTVNVGSFASLPVTINNSGDASLIISDITSSDAQYTISGSLPLTVLPGGNTAVDITFTPTGEGTYPASLSFTHNAPGSPAVLPVTGTGHILASTFNIDPVSLSFGTVNVGSSASLPVTINNSGDASLIISDITSSDAQYTISGSLPLTVLPGGNAAIDITFTPTGEGTYPASLYFTHNASGSPDSLSLTGTGHVLISVFNTNPLSLNFGDVTVDSSATLPVTISNSGDASLIISNIASSDTQYTFTSSVLPIVIPAGQTGIIDVTFTPAAGGIINAVLTFTHNAAGGSTVYDMQGRGIMTSFQLTVNVENGWNMVSIPGLHPANQEVLTWWPGKDPQANVFTYVTRLVPVQTLVPGRGYWLKNAGANSYNTGDEWPSGARHRRSRTGQCSSGKAFSVNSGRWLFLSRTRCRRRQNML